MSQLEEEGAGGESPGEDTRITVGAVARPLPPPKRRSTERSAAATAAERRVAGLAAGALAAPALVLPIPWLGVVMLLRLAVGARRRAALAEQRMSLPLAVAATVGSGTQGLVRRLPGHLIRLILASVVAVGVPAIVAGLLWLASNGSLGSLVAGRLAAYEHAIGLLSAILCWRLLRSEEPDRARRAVLGRGLGSISEGGLVAVGAVSVAWIALVALAVKPSTWAPWSSLADATGVLPGATRTAVLDLQRSAISGEVDAALRCLATEGRDVGWQQRGTVRNPDGTLTVTINRRPVAGASLYTVSALVLALHNQLPTAVSSLVVRRRADFNPLVVDRRAVSTSDPITNSTELAAAAHVDRSILPGSNEVTRLGLKCGAAAP